MEIKEIKEIKVSCYTIPSWLLRSACIPPALSHTLYHLRPHVSVAPAPRRARFVVESERLRGKGRPTQVHGAGDRGSLLGGGALTARDLVGGK